MTGESGERRKPTLWAISDVHVGHQGNRPVIDQIRPSHRGDWLIVAGDVAEKAEDVRWTLSTLAERFARVIWVPGNHELWTTARDPIQMYGVSRYEYLVAMCRELGVLTPEDPYPLWNGAGGPARLVPMFLLYDYSFLPRGARTPAEGLSIAKERNVVATDEYVLSPQPFATRDAWCRARLEYTTGRLAELSPDEPTVLINHFPLVRQPTDILMYPEFALWCGTTATADWHLRYNAICAVYGHLHIPRTTWYDGVRFEEVSLGYPREWAGRGGVPEPLLRRILPAPDYGPDDLNEFGGHFRITPQMRAAHSERMAKLKETQQ